MGPLTSVATIGFELPLWCRPLSYCTKKATKSSRCTASVMAFHLPGAATRVLCFMLYVCIKKSRPQCNIMGTWLLLWFVFKIFTWKSCSQNCQHAYQQNWTAWPTVNCTNIMTPPLLSHFAQSDLLLLHEPQLFQSKPCAATHYSVMIRVLNDETQEKLKSFGQWQHG